MNTTVNQTPNRRSAVLLAGLLILLSTITGPGCVTLKELCGKECAPKGAPCQVVVRWEHEVAHAADPTRGGAMIPGMACRVYLFGQNIDFPMGCDGAVGVELFNVTDGATPTEPLETWKIDPVTLERLCRKDAIGWGYTLFLPWSTMKPEIRELRMRLKFETAKGQVLYHDSGAFKLHTQPAAMGPKTNSGPAMHTPPVQTVPQTPVKPQGAPLPAPTPLPTLPPPRTTAPANLTSRTSAPANPTLATATPRLTH